MDIKDFAILVYKKKRLVLYFLLVFVTSSAVFTAVQPFNYSAKTKLMIVQSFEREMDPYSIAKSNQQVSLILVNVILSSSFYDSIFDSEFDIKKDYFYDFRRSEIEMWNEVVSVGAIDDTGIISIEVLHTDKYQAEEAIMAITDTIKSKYKDYYKVTQNIEIKVLDKVRVSNFPVQPNVLMNIGLGISLAIIASLCYIYMFAEKMQQEMKLKGKNSKGRGESSGLQIVNNKGKKTESSNKKLRVKGVKRGNGRKAFTRHNNQEAGKNNKKAIKGDIKNLFG